MNPASLYACGRTRATAWKIANRAQMSQSQKSPLKTEVFQSIRGVPDSEEERDICPSNQERGLDTAIPGVYYDHDRNLHTVAGARSAFGGTCRERQGCSHTQEICTKPDLSSSSCRQTLSGTWLPLCVLSRRERIRVNPMLPPRRTATSVGQFAKQLRNTPDHLAAEPDVGARLSG